MFSLDPSQATAESWKDNFVLCDADWSGTGQQPRIRNVEMNRTPCEESRRYSSSSKRGFSCQHSTGLLIPDRRQLSSPRHADRASPTAIGTASLMLFSNECGQHSVNPLELQYPKSRRRWQSEAVAPSPFLNAQTLSTSYASWPGPGLGRDSFYDACDSSATATADASAPAITIALRFVKRLQRARPYIGCR